MTVDARQVHRGEGVCADGITVHIHPQALEVERGTVSSHTILDAHRRRETYPVMLRAEWTADVRPVSTYLLLTRVRLVIVRSVSEHGIVGIQAHHQIEVLVGKDTAGGVGYYLDVPYCEDVRRRAAIALRRGEGGQTTQQCKNHKRSVHFDFPLGSLAGARVETKFAGIGQRWLGMERVMGIEPTLAAWEAAVLPLNYTRAGD